MEKATFGAGCFWGVEAAFRKVDGVSEVISGYSGGATDNPTYEDVCTGKTGHAEVVQIDFDPATVSFDQLLDKLWDVHDPTTLNRQGPDIGTQYRSAVYYHSADQEARARKSIARLEESGRVRNPVVTEVAPFSAFWPAEEYHQRYFEKAGYGH